MQKFILFQDGKPKKGFYCEIDLMNEYSRMFDQISTAAEKSKKGKDGKAQEWALYRFFKRIQPAKYIKAKRGYRSLMREYIKGENENEAGIVVNLDWETLSPKSKLDFNKFCRRFEKRLERLTIDNYNFEPEEKITHGIDYGD